MDFLAEDEEAGSSPRALFLLGEGGVFVFSPPSTAPSPPSPSLPPLFLFPASSLANSSNTSFSLLPPVSSLHGSELLFSNSTSYSSLLPLSVYMTIATRRVRILPRISTRTTCARCHRSLSFSVSRVLTSSTLPV